MTELDTSLPDLVSGQVRVLVVDDTPSLRVLTRLALQDSGFLVVGEAGDGLAAVEQARRLRPDLVLLDLAMPVMDGLEALPLLRDVLPGVKVVIVSGFDRQAMESQVVEAGADGYLQKGLSPEVSLSALRRLFPTAATAALPAPRPSPDAVPTEAHRQDRDRLAELEEDLEQLLYVLSHDLSEPVHVVKGFAERLARRAGTDEEGEFCEYILDAADRMQLLLDGLLDYARAGRGELPSELLDCRRLVDAVVAGLGRSLADTGGRVTVGALPHEVVGNRMVLTQVLHNLIANGLKFVRPGVVPQVQVEAVRAGGTVTFRVSDNGIGVEAGQEERVFEPFKRLHSRERYPGSGIGLAICRRLVQRHGGRIWLEHGDPGTTFLVEVPQ